MLNAPIYRSEDYYRLRERHGATPEEIARHKAHTWPEPKYVPAPKTTVQKHMCGPAIEALYASAKSRPPLKALVDAMRLDGFPETEIQRVRANYARRRATDDKRQSDLEKIFGKFSGPGRGVVKKAVKAVKKRT